jgi:hypothetical protein
MNQFRPKNFREFLNFIYIILDKIESKN